MNQFNYYVEGRVFEWVMGLSLLLVGLEFVAWPHALQHSAFSSLEGVFINAPSLTLFVLFLGWSRCTALMLNGQRLFGFKLGPAVRAGGCVLSAMLWVEFALALIQQSFTQDSPSPGIPFWIMFTLGDLYAAYTTVKNG